MSDLVCPQCLIPDTIDCREDDCPGETRFLPRAEIPPLSPTAKLLATMGSRIKDLETLMLTLDDYLNGTGPAGEVSTYCRLIGEEARRIRGQKPTEHVKSGAARILMERNRQITQEGWSAQHDAGYPPGVLEAAAECYLGDLRRRESPGEEIWGVPSGWPWDKKWWKPTGGVRQLEKVGALIAAAIDLRLAKDGKEGAGHGG